MKKIYLCKNCRERVHLGFRHECKKEIIITSSDVIEKEISDLAYQALKENEWKIGVQTDPLQKHLSAFASIR